MENFTIVHPNNKLTRIDNLTIPSLENYLKSINSQLKELRNIEGSEQSAHSTTSSLPKEVGSHIDKAKMKRLKEFKKSEWKYIKSYLNILKSLESICKTCSSSENESICSSNSSYDFEKEDEILNQIEEEMKNFRKLELELARNKEIFETDGKYLNGSSQITDRQRRDSLVKLEQDLVENVEHVATR